MTKHGMATVEESGDPNYVIVKFDTPVELNKFRARNGLTPPIIGDWMISKERWKEIVEL